MKFAFLLVLLLALGLQRCAVHGSASYESIDEWGTYLIDDDVNDEIDDDIEDAMSKLGPAPSDVLTAPIKAVTSPISAITALHFLMHVRPINVAFKTLNSTYYNDLHSLFSSYIQQRNISAEVSPSVASTIINAGSSSSPSSSPSTSDLELDRDSPQGSSSQGGSGHGSQGGNSQGGRSQGRSGGGSSGGSSGQYINGRDSSGRDNNGFVVDHLGNVVFESSLFGFLVKDPLQITYTEIALTNNARYSALRAISTAHVQKNVTAQNVCVQKFQSYKLDVANVTSFFQDSSTCDYECITATVTNLAKSYIQTMISGAPPPGLTTADLIVDQLTILGCTNALQDMFNYVTAKTTVST